MVRKGLYMFSRIYKVVEIFTNSYVYRFTHTYNVKTFSLNSLIVYRLIRKDFRA